MNLKDAQAKAEQVRSIIAPLCKVADESRAPLCIIAGSVRRQKMDMIKDIELVSVPDSRKLFELAEVVNKKWGPPTVGKYPSKYTRIRGLYNLDLFWCSLETFGLNCFIRTGPQSFCVRALAHWKKISNGGCSEGAILYRGDGTAVKTPTEKSVFEALQWDFVKPEYRL